MTIAFLVSVAPFAPLVTIMHGHDVSATATGHYFAGTFPHFPLYSPYNDDYYSLNFGSIAISAFTFYIMVSNTALHFTIKISK